MRDEKTHRDSFVQVLRLGQRAHLIHNQNGPTRTKDFIVQSIACPYRNSKEPSRYGIN